MKLKYYPDTDSLYIDLSGRPSVGSREISEGAVLDYDEAGNCSLGFPVYRTPPPLNGRIGA